VFKQGDRVVYPHHGAGIIEAVQEKCVLSEKREYYILKLPVAQLTINVPVDNCLQLGLRGVINRPTALKVLRTLSDKARVMPDDSNERYRLNNEKIATGNAFSLAEVIKDLSEFSVLSSREKRMLLKAKNLLVSELMHSLEKTETEVTKKVDKLLN